MEGYPIKVWEELDSSDQVYESRNSLNANGWLIFATETGARGLRLYPRDWCKLPEHRLRELYRRARPRIGDGSARLKRRSGNDGGA